MSGSVPGGAVPGGAPEFDLGLQSERTTLAWQRAALSVAVGSLVLMRLAADWIGLLGVPIGLVGVIVAAFLFARSARRHPRLLPADHPLASTVALPGAALLLLLAAVALAFGLGALFFVLFGALR